MIGNTTDRGSLIRFMPDDRVFETVNFNGELEQLINTGLGYSNLLKGRQK